MRNYKNDYDASFATDADYEDGFVESDAAKFERMRRTNTRVNRDSSDDRNSGGGSPGGLTAEFDFNRKPAPKKEPEKIIQQTMQKAADFEYDVKREGEKVFKENDSESKPTEPIIGPVTKSKSMNSGDVGKYRALEDMTPEELVSMGYEPKTFAPIEKDTGLSL